MIFRVIFLLCTSISISISESVSDNPTPFPPKNATVIEISKDKVFRLQKLVSPPPEKVGPEYFIHKDLTNMILTVKTKAGLNLYEVAIPPIQKIAPELYYSDSTNAFGGARVTQSGRSILHYYATTEFIYSSADHKFILMPDYVKDADSVFQVSSWSEFSKDLFYAHLSTAHTEGDGIVIYDANTNKVYRLSVAANFIFDSEYVSLFNYDSVHSIVEVKKLKKQERGRDAEIEIKENLGYYRIEPVP